MPNQLLLGGFLVNHNTCVVLGARIFFCLDPDLGGAGQLNRTPNGGNPFGQMLIQACLNYLIDLSMAGFCLAAFQNGPVQKLSKP
jgi:hypothetical protein